jgi:F-type H+-transporting ATPase subunit b
MKQLGIEPSLLLAQIVNFTIIALVLGKFLYQPILKMLAKRKLEIETGLKNAEKMQLEEVKLQEREKKLIDQAKKDAKEIIENAKKDASNVEKQIIAESHEEANAIVNKAKVEVDRLGVEMRKSVRKEAIDLASEMAKRITSSVLSDADQHKLISQQLKKLETI